MGKRRIEIPCSSGDGDKTALKITEVSKLVIHMGDRVHFLNTDTAKDLRDALDCYIESDGETLKPERFSVEVLSQPFRILDQVGDCFVQLGGYYLRYERREDAEKVVKVLNELEGE